VVSARVSVLRSCPSFWRRRTGWRPPALTVPTDITAEATGPAGAVVDGVVDATRINAAIQPLGGGRYLLLASGAGAELTGTRNPVPVSLAVGDDSGTTTIIAAIH
jgi:hypothetical protein